VSYVYGCKKTRPYVRAVRPARTYGPDVRVVCTELKVGYCVMAHIVNKAITLAVVFKAWKFVWTGLLDGVERPPSFTYMNSVKGLCDNVTSGVVVDVFYTRAGQSHTQTQSKAPSEKQPLSGIPQSQVKPQPETEWQLTPLYVLVGAKTTYVSNA